MFNILEQLLEKYGKKVIQTARQKLVDLGKNASGKLSKSLNYKIAKLGDKLQIIFFGIDYLKDVEYGRAAGQRPPVGKILQWMQYKGLPDKDSKSKAFLIARKIGDMGIKPTPFLKDSMISVNDELRSGMTKELSDYFIRDIKKNILK